MDAAARSHAEGLAAGAACLEAGLAYLARGWSVLCLCPPDHVGVGKAHAQGCGHPGKRPLANGGAWKEYQGRLPTEEELREWWRRHPNANVGAALGPVSQLVRVDVEGAAAQARLLEVSGGDRPPTCAFRSGRRDGTGRGLLYALPDGVEARTSVQGLEAGGELRVQGCGAQTVLPPSRHVDGGVYAWEPGCSPAEIDPAPAPAWLLALLQAPRAVQVPGVGEGELIRAGICDTVLTRWAGGMRRDSFSEDAIRAALQVEIEAGRCEQEEGKRAYDATDAARIARSVARYPPDPYATTALLRAAPNGHAPRGPRPYIPFPTDALPALCRDFVVEAAAAMGCDAAYVALPALAALASVVGNSRVVVLKSGWAEPSVLWTAVVGDSGTLKSPAWKAALRHLFRVQAARFAAHHAEAEKWRRDGREGDAPVASRLVCSDATVERLAELLDDNPRGLLLARDELAGWVGSFTRYKGKSGGTDLPNWLEMHQAGLVTVDRKTGERRTLFVPRAAVSVAGGVQPKVLRRVLTSEFLDSGLAARLLMAMPPRPRKRWTEAEVSDRTSVRWGMLLDALLALQMQDGEDRRLEPRPLGLTHDGKLAWVAWYEEWAARQEASEGELAAAYSKLEGCAARLALIHAMAESVVDDPAGARAVDAADVEAGAKLARWFGGECRRVYAMLSETDEEGATRSLLDFVRVRGGKVSARDLMRGNCKRYPTAEVAETAMAALVQQGLAEWLEARQGKAVGLRRQDDAADEESLYDGMTV